MAVRKPEPFWKQKERETSIGYYTTESWESLFPFTLQDFWAEYQRDYSPVAALVRMGLSASHASDVVAPAVMQRPEVLRLMAEHDEMLAPDTHGALYKKTFALLYRIANSAESKPSDKIAAIKEMNRILEMSDHVQEAKIEVKNMTDDQLRQIVPGLLPD